MDDERQASRSSARLVFIDVLRLVAAAQMIQGHSIDAVLGPSHRAGPVHAAWSFARGLTSVTFLVMAGLAFALAEARDGSRAARARRARRALFLVAVGYLMHAPLGVLLGSPPREALRAALVVDVLQCIGVSLLGLELMTARLSRPRTRALAALGLSALCLFAAPFCVAVEPAGLARGLQNYLTPRGGSPFPLVPWSGYLLGGFAAGVAAFRSGSGAPWVLGAAGLACGVAALASAGHFVDVPPNARPPYCLLKLGCVLAASGLLMRALRDVRALPPLLARLSRETLFLYVSHVVILYADHVGLAWLLGTRHPPWVAAALAVALLVGCSEGALVVPRAFRTLRGAARGGMRGGSP